MLEVGMGGDFHHARQSPRHDVGRCALDRIRDQSPVSKQAQASSAFGDQDVALGEKCHRPRVGQPERQDTEADFRDLVRVDDDRALRQLDRRQARRATHRQRLALVDVFRPVSALGDPETNGVDLKEGEVEAGSVGGHPVLRELGGYPQVQLALRWFTRNDRVAAAEIGEGEPPLVQTQVGLSCGRIRAMALVAVGGQQRSDLGLEVDRGLVLRECREGEHQQHRREKRASGGSAGEVTPQMRSSLLSGMDDLIHRYLGLRCRGPSECPSVLSRARDTKLLPPAPREETTS